MNRYVLIFIFLAVFFLAQPAQADAPNVVTMAQGDLNVINCEGDLVLLPSSSHQVLVLCGKVTVRLTPTATPSPTSTPTPTLTPSTTSPFSPTPITFTPTHSSTLSPTPSITPTPTAQPASQQNPFPFPIPDSSIITS